MLHIGLEHVARHELRFKSCWMCYLVWGH